VFAWQWVSWLLRFHVMLVLVGLRYANPTYVDAA